MRGSVHVNRDVGKAEGAGLTGLLPSLVCEFPTCACTTDRQTSLRPKRDPRAVGAGLYLLTQRQHSPGLDDGHLLLVPQVLKHKTGQGCLARAPTDSQRQTVLSEQCPPPSQGQPHPLKVSPHSQGQPSLSQSHRYLLKVSPTLSRLAPSLKVSFQWQRHSL